MADYIASDLDCDEKNAWGTDPLVFAALNDEFNFKLDVAASEDNTLCELYLTSEIDALKEDWSGVLKHGLGNDTKLNAWCNPRMAVVLFSDLWIKQLSKKLKALPRQCWYRRHSMHNGYH